MSTNDTSQPMATLAMRLIFEYEGDQVRLVSQQPVDLAITGFDIARTQRPGYYVDTRDTVGKTLARVPARGAFSDSVEVFPEQPGEQISRTDVPAPRGAFTVVVPIPEGADHVSIVRVAPAEPTAKLSPSAGISPVPGSPEITEIAKFSLRVSH